VLICLTAGIVACRLTTAVSPSPDVLSVPTAPVEHLPQVDLASDYAWENYQPNSIENMLAQVAEEALVENLQNNQLYIETSPAYQFLSTVDVSYSGTCHAIPETRLLMIQQWMGIFGVSSIEEVEKKYLFEKECLFAEGAAEYWLPVQNLLLPYIQDSFTAGDELKLFVVWMGASKVNGVLDHVILINNIFVEEPPG